MRPMILALLFTSLTLWGCGDSGGGGAQAQIPTVNTTSLEVMTEVLFKRYIASDTDGVQGVSCPADSVAISAGCICPILSSGDIFSVSVAGNTGICACDVTIIDGEVSVDGPFEVSVICASAVIDEAISDVTLSKQQTKNQNAINKEKDLERMLDEKISAMQ